MAKEGKRRENELIWETAGDGPISLFLKLALCVIVHGCVYLITFLDHKAFCFYWEIRPAGWWKLSARTNHLNKHDSISTLTGTSIPQEQFAHAVMEHSVAAGSCDNSNSDNIGTTLSLKLRCGCGCVNILEQIIRFFSTCKLKVNPMSELFLITNCNVQNIISV